jgi:hypothetical protein
VASGDYPGSTFYGANSANYSAANRPSSDPINKIIIHVMEGSFTGTVEHFQRPVEASAHYSIRTYDGHVGQHVREKDIAYHAGYWDYNRTSIGIEHEGSVSDPDAFTPGMYNYSARLTAYLCRKYRIPADRRYIIGHNEVPGCSGGSGGGAYCHTDPGPYWDWPRYMSLVRARLAYSQVVDNTTPGRFYAAKSWGTSTWSPQKYGGSYRFTPPRSVASNARFRVRVPSRGRYAVYGRWPANSGYNDRAVFRIYTVDGWRGRAANQRTNGGRWVYLGTYTMHAGDGWYVQVSNKTSGKGYIIADAVKIVRQ